MSAIFFLVYLCLFVHLAETDSLVTCPWGKIKGIEMTSPTGKNYTGYYGIPYAQQPVGNLRFKAPLPLQKNTGIFNASQYGAVCIQPKVPNAIPESEDCLTLNVVVPNSRTPNMAVMVWIHGGGFAQGGARMYEPWKLVTEGDVIVVVIQYRLGVFGFLSTGSSDLSGNAALKDQNLALKWVNDNIRSFGGDPDRVTVFGESAGGGSTSLHTLSPASKGLFNRFIMQSGSAIALWSDDRNVRHKFDTVVNGLGCGDKETDESRVRCVQNAPIEKVRPFVNLNFGPSVDGQFMPDHPTTLVKNKTYLSSIGFYALDGMVGVNNDEGGVLSAADRNRDNAYIIEKYTSDNYINDFLIPMIVNGTVGHFDPLVAEVIRYEYTAPKELPKSAKYKDVRQMYGDSAFIAPAIGFARAHCIHGKTFMYYFNHYPNITDKTANEGLYHGLDLRYLFGFNPGNSVLYEGMGHSDIELSDLFVRFISEFGKTGNPSPAVQSYLGGPWTQFDPIEETYLSFTNNLTVGQHLRSKRVAFWLDLIPDLLNRQTERQTVGQSTGTSVCQLSISSNVKRPSETVLFIATIVYWCLG